MIDDDTCLAWGSRIARISFLPEHVHAAYSIIKHKLHKEYKTKFMSVGENTLQSGWCCFKTDVLTFNIGITGLYVQICVLNFT